MPSSKDPLVKEKYVKSGLGWYQNVFASDFDVLALDYKKYELLRFWLLGSWNSLDKYITKSIEVLL